MTSVSPTPRADQLGERVRLLVVQRPVEYMVDQHTYEESFGAVNIFALTGHLQESGTFTTEQNGTYQLSHTPPKDERIVSCSTDTYIWSTMSDEDEYVGQVHVIESPE
jgi:hypothetical protein